MIAIALITGFGAFAQAGSIVVTSTGNEPRISTSAVVLPAAVTAAPDKAMTLVELRKKHIDEMAELKKNNIDEIKALRDSMKGKPQEEIKTAVDKMKAAQKESVKSLQEKCKDEIAQFRKDHPAKHHKDAAPATKQP